VKLLVTGVAGFIGMHVAQRLLERGDEVVGIDNLNDYYDPRLKHARLAQLTRHRGFRFDKLDVADQPAMAALFAGGAFERVVHLAAQAGVRYSILNPHAYAQANLVGFLNVLECCRQSQTQHLVYASSSSVYGGSPRLPLAETHAVDHPVSLYAATKKANELMAHSYSHLYALPTTGLRFFTVYGPWGRPDMAPYLFTDAIANGRPIKVFNHGQMRRDFTYIDDIVSGVVAALDRTAQADSSFDAAQPDPATSHAPYRVFNIGNSESIELGRFIAAIEAALGKVAVRELLPMQPGDVTATHADTSRLEAWAGFRSTTSIEEGMRRFVDWYRSFHAA
jgi:UDP-glucuronate 4-epimerase